MTAALVGAVSYQTESLSPELWQELLPCLQAHYDEIAHYKDIPLSPDHAKYEALQRAGLLRVVTARDERVRLIGYHCAIVCQGLHYSTVIMANQDVLWVAKEHRGGRVGNGLLNFAEASLAQEGVTVLFQHTKVIPHLDLGRWLMRRGYEPMDTIYAKRLDRI